MNTVTLPDGTQVPALGLGTWRFGERSAARREEIAAVRRALQIGYRLIDTAEMYGDGGAEEVVGHALADAVAAGEVQRRDVFLVSKVLPNHASRRGVRQACDRSRRRLGVERIDLYLLHWRGGVPLAETVDALAELQAEGAIGAWGVSNFDVADMEELWGLESGSRCATNQVYYSMRQRGIEYDLLPWQRARHLPTMAYSPIDQGDLANDGKLAGLASELGVTAAQLALAWVLRQPDVIAIPKAGREAHQLDNWRAATLRLPTEVQARLDAVFPPPKRKRPLAMT